MAEEHDQQSPQHWRDRAHEARAKANGMSSPELKARMLDVAAKYDKLAEYVEHRDEKTPAAPLSYTLAQTDRLSGPWVRIDLKGG